MHELAQPIAAPPQRPRGLRLNAKDNVAVLLSDAPPGPVEIVGPAAAGEAVLAETVASGHKVALRPIGKGEEIIKFGVAIGIATSAIEVGTWVHTHNCRSRLDERSHTLDPHSGAPTDNRYN